MPSPPPCGKRSGRALMIITRRRRPTTTRSASCWTNPARVCSRGSTRRRTICRPTLVEAITASNPGAEEGIGGSVEWLQASRRRALARGGSCTLDLPTFPPQSAGQPREPRGPDHDRRSGSRARPIPCHRGRVRWSAASILAARCRCRHGPRSGPRPDALKLWCIRLHAVAARPREKRRRERPLRADAEPW